MCPDLKFARHTAFAAFALLGVALAAGRAMAQNDLAAQSMAAQLQLRIDQLEDEIRTLTGEGETQSHQIQVLTQQLEKMRSDTELRLNDIEAKLGIGAGGQSAPASPAPDAPTAPAPSGNFAPGAAPRTLGTIPAGPALAPAGEAANAPQQQYQVAFDMVSRGNYGDAEKVFRAFLAQYPKDPLASNAAYYIGESAYVRGKYQDAAVAFADAYQKYPKGAKAPDTLLELGRSLDKLNRTPDACAAFAQIGAKFPSAPPAIKRQALQEKTRLKCG